MRTLSRRPYLMAISLLLLLACAAPPLLAAEATPAGSVKSASGDTQVNRQNSAPLALKSGDRIFEGDILTTGKEGSLGLVMRDNSTLSLGPNTRLIIERFMFAPEKGELASVIRLTRGSLAGVSGEITKLKPESAKVITPSFIVGIRGTHFLISVPPDQEEPDPAPVPAPPPATAPTAKERR